MENLKQYRKDVIKNFLTKFLEIEAGIAEKDALELSGSISEETTIKLVHFMDCMLQCSSSNTQNSCSKDSNCGSCCGNCHCKN